MRVVEVVTRDEVDWTERSRQFAAATDEHTFEPERVLVIDDNGKRRHLCFPAASRHGYFVRVHAHHPVCAECGDYWPCQHERNEWQAKAFKHELDDQCQQCGQPVGSRNSILYGGPNLDIPGEMGARFHTAKKFTKCRAAAERYGTRWRERQRSNA